MSQTKGTIDNITYVAKEQFGCVGCAFEDDSARCAYSSDAWGCSTGTRGDGRSIIWIKEEPMNKPHKHADLIKAWADNPQLQLQFRDVGAWEDFIKNPDWSYSEVRIKPQPKPDIVKHIQASLGTQYPALSLVYKESGGNLKLTFDGETGKLKSVELLG